MAKRSFQYQQRSKDDLKERANARGGNYDSFLKPALKIYKVREGKNLVRILPPTWEKARHYGYDIYVNYGIGADNQSYLSLSKMKNEPDPLLEGKRKAERDGDEEVARALRPTQRILMWVVDRMDEDAGPQLWAAPLGLDKGIANAAFDEDTNEIVYIDDPAKGADVRFYREGSGLKTKYPGEKIKVLPQSPIHEDEALEQEWLDYVDENPIPDALNYYDYEHIAGVYNGNVRTASDDDEDEKPKRKPRDEDDEKPSKVRRAKPDPEEDDEPEEQPARSKRARAEPEEEPRRGRARSEPKEEAEEDPVPRTGSIRDRLQKAREAMSDKGKKRSEPDEDE